MKDLLTSAKKFWDRTAAGIRSEIERQRRRTADGFERDRTARRGEYLDKSLQTAVLADEMKAAVSAFPDLVSELMQYRDDLIIEVADADEQWHLAEVRFRATAGDLRLARFFISLIGMISVLFLLTGADNETIFSSKPGVHANSNTARLICAILAILAACFTLFLTISPPIPATWRRRAIRKDIAASITNFQTRADSIALDLLSKAINAKINASKSIRELRVTSAPRLVEISVLDATPSGSITKARAFIEDHTTSAIGISGPRGVGKTTIIQSLCQDRPRYIGAYVTAPVAYSADDLLKVLLGTVAKSVLRHYKLPDKTESPKTQAVLLLRLIGSLAAILVGVLLVTLGRASMSWRLSNLDILGGVVCSVGAIVFVSSYALYIRNLTLSRTRPSTSPAASRARKVLEDLRFSTTMERSHANRLKAWLWELGDEDKTSVAQVEISHAERVAGLRDFILEITRTTEASVVIGIDELDKVARGKDVIRLINDLKDLMHIPGCHFVVSVSEDALSNFALRGVPVRDVFDSTFDFVFPVQRLSPSEAVELIQKRVIDFPYLLTLACYVLSGGLPRDLIRAVRLCVDYRRISNCDVLVGDVVRQLIVDTALSVLDASVDRLSRKESAIAVSGLFTIRNSLAELNCDVDKALRELSAQFETLVRARGKSARLNEASMAFFLGLAVTYEYFHRLLSMTSEELATALNGEALLLEVGGLAAAFAVLPKSPAEAISRAQGTLHSE